MLKHSLKKICDIRQRHQERHSSLQLNYAIADRIDFLNAADWDRIAAGKSLFLSRAYLQAIEACTPANIRACYALIYQQQQPIAILACQIADIGGEQLRDATATGRSTRLLRRVQQRILVCGNLVSSGLHGVGFSDELGPEHGWRAVAEALYRIRRGAKLDGTIDFALIKDLKGCERDAAQVLNRYSYRPIETDPDMVLTFAAGCDSYHAYLNLLTSKYRSKLKKTRQNLLDAGFQIERLSEQQVVEQDLDLHALYREVEQRAPVRLATLTPGYFAAMAQALGPALRCTAIRQAERLVGFILTLNDGGSGIAYYVGVDYQVNAEHPVYLCLLQLSVEDALMMGCHELSMGRSALEPKANLGAKPVDTQVWLRHRVPLVNFTLRQFFTSIPYDTAPERHALKSDTPG